MTLELEALLTSARAPAMAMTIASIATVVAIGDPRHPRLRQWRWLWLFLVLNAVFNSRSFLPQEWAAPFGRITTSVGRLLYMPPLLLGLASIIAHGGYRRYARIGAFVLAMQLVAALFVGGILPTGVPILRTVISTVIILAVAAPAVIARLPRVRGSILQDPPMMAAIAALLAYGSPLLFSAAAAGRGTASREYITLLWLRNLSWILAYAIWWYAFLKARREERPA